MIFTGYFARGKLYARENLVMISIARYAPKGYKGFHLEALYPSPSLLSAYKNGSIHEAEYTSIYRQMLKEEISPEQVVEQIAQMAGERSPVLVCYEKPTEFCHRHIVSEWLRQHGYDSSEYPIPK